jgi:hypothetical protein
MKAKQEETFPLLDSIRCASNLRAAPKWVCNILSNGINKYILKGSDDGV